MYYDGDHKSQTLEIVFQMLQTILHCSYIIPYILRCYRIYFIFHIEKNWNENDTRFKKELYKASQKWLFKIYCICMIPVLIFAFMNLVPGFHGYFPTTYFQRSQKENDITEIIYLFVLFVEEMLFVLFVFALRKVNDDYKMTREISAVCFL